MSVNPITAVGASGGPTVAAPAPATSTGSSTSTAAGANSSTGTKTSGTTAMPGGLLDRDAFLKLLVAQLKYQDPTKPMDSSQLVSQSAQLSVVDKLNEISTLLTSSGAANRLSLGGSLVGKQITFPDVDGTLKSAIATSVSFDGTNTVVHAGTFDVPLEMVRSIAAAPGGAAAS